MLSAPVVAVVLLAAALHAGWNVAVRAGGDRRRETALLVVGGAVIAVCSAAIPAAAARGCMAVPDRLGGLNALYFMLIAEAYARGGVALAYPLMRGVAPMLTLIAAWLLLGEALPTVVWLGVATICCGRGAAGTAARRRRMRRRRCGSRWPMRVVIAAYTLIDAVGARISQAPMAYTLWLFPLVGRADVAVAASRDAPGAGRAPMRWHAGWVAPPPASAHMRWCCGR